MYVCVSECDRCLCVCVSECDRCVCVCVSECDRCVCACVYRNAIAIPDVNDVNDVYDDKSVIYVLRCYCDTRYGLRGWSHTTKCKHIYR